MLHRGEGDQKIPSFSYCTSEAGKLLWLWRRDEVIVISPVGHLPSAAAQETHDVHHTSSAWAGSLLDLFSRAFFSPRRFLTCISQLRSSFGKLAFGQGWLGNSASRRCPESQRHVCALIVRGASILFLRQQINIAIVFGLGFAGHKCLYRRTRAFTTSFRGMSHQSQSHQG